MNDPRLVRWAFEKFLVHMDDHPIAFQKNKNKMNPFTIIPLDALVCTFLAVSPPLQVFPFKGQNDRSVSRLITRWRVFFIFMTNQYFKPSVRFKGFHQKANITFTNTVYLVYIGGVR